MVVYMWNICTRFERTLCFRKFIKMKFCYCLKKYVYDKNNSTKNIYRNCTSCKFL